MNSFWLCFLIGCIGLSVFQLCEFAATGRWVNLILAIWQASLSVIAMHEVRVSKHMARICKAADYHLDKMRFEAENGALNPNVFEHHSEQADAVIAEMRELEKRQNPWRYSKT